MSLAETITLQHWADRNKTVESCYFPGFFEDAGTANEYQFRSTFWMLFLLRLAFVVVFEHLVFTIQSIIQVMIPDVPGDVELKSLREQYLSNLIFTKAQEQAAQSNNVDNVNAIDKQNNKIDKDMPDKMKGGKTKKMMSKMGPGKVNKKPRMRVKAVNEFFSRKASTDKVSPEVANKMKCKKSFEDKKKRNKSIDEEPRREEDIENGLQSTDESSEESDSAASDQHEPISRKQRGGFFLARFLKNWFRCGNSTS